jgi:hypothetical protein
MAHVDVDIPSACCHAEAERNLAADPPTRHLQEVEVRPLLGAATVLTPSTTPSHASAGGGAIARRPSAPAPGSVTTAAGSQVLRVGGEGQGGPGPDTWQHTAADRSSAPSEMRGAAGRQVADLHVLRHANSALQAAGADGAPATAAGVHPLRPASTGKAAGLISVGGHSTAESYRSAIASTGTCESLG